jgi:hypothetical protein
MTKITSMPKETAAELLYFIAENERFSSVESRLKGDFTVPQVRALLREVAADISTDVTAETTTLGKASLDAQLSSRAKDVIASLTAEEERKLLTAFGIISK